MTKSDEERDDGSVSGAMSRDEKLVQEMNIPCSVEEIISKPMEEFNDLLSRHSVSEDVINVCLGVRNAGAWMVSKNGNQLQKFKWLRPAADPY